jgi:DHA1 family bicyclomycin/chloramphenicol resistance-like MFS transporter
MQSDAMTSRAIVIYCGFLMSLSAFSVDITLPSFPAMTTTLSAPYDRVQFSVTIYIFSLGIGQLMWGSISDRFGRKPALAAGLAIYLAGSVMTILSTSIDFLLAGRLVQGIGGAAGVVCSRAIIRDLFSGDELARNLALATAIFAFGPIVAPLLGAGIAAIANWRFIFIGMTAFSAVLLLVLTRLPETNIARNKEATNPAAFLQRTIRLFVHPQSRYFLLLSAIIMSSMILIVSSVPRIYDRNFGITGTLFAIFFSIHGIGIIFGQFANRRLISSAGTERALLFGNFVLVFASGLVAAFAVAGLLNAYLTSGLLVLFATSYMIAYSNAAALVLDPHGDIAGHAASIYGFLSQIGSAIIVSLLVGPVGDSLVAWSAALFGICLICLVAEGLWISRKGAGHGS